MIKSLLNRVLVFGFVSGALSLASGCGGAGFVPIALEDVSKAGGSVVIPPKVDLVVFVDNSGGINAGYDEVEEGIHNFLTQLDAQDWDYHLTMAPLLTQDFTVSGVFGSKFDPNSTPWTPPFPGAKVDEAGTIPSYLFRTVDEFILPVGDRNNLGRRAGLSTIENYVTSLLSSSDETNALRQDSIKVIVAFSYANDNSGLHEPVMDHATGQMTVQGRLLDFIPWKNKMKQKYGSSTAFQFYSAVAQNYADTLPGASCHGVQPFLGGRYRVASDASFDICSDDATSIFAKISSNLTEQRLSFRTRHLFVTSDAEESSIHIIRHGAGGDVEIPYGTQEGWEYLGFQEGVYTFDFPASLNLRSGFAIRLNGSARLSGDETASITYRAKGTNTAVVE